ncbi:MAG: hypothetical protein Q9163_003540 [Psora crenata]
MSLSSTDREYYPLSHKHFDYLSKFFEGISSTNIGDTSSSFNLEGGADYSALSLKKDGTLEYSFIDLNKYLGNKNGKFITGNKDYLLSGQDFHLDETGLVLCAKLLDYDKKYVDATFDLSTTFANPLETYRDTGFDRNSIYTQFVETVPYIGYLAVAGHLNANNPV